MLRGLVALVKTHLTFLLSKGRPRAKREEASEEKERKKTESGNNNLSSILRGEHYLFFSLGQTEEELDTHFNPGNEGK